VLDVPMGAHRRGRIRNRRRPPSASMRDAWEPLIQRWASSGRLSAAGRATQLRAAHLGNSATCWDQDKAAAIGRNALLVGAAEQTAYVAPTSMIWWCGITWLLLTPATAPDLVCRRPICAPDPPQRATARRAPPDRRATGAR